AVLVAQLALQALGGNGGGCRLFGEDLAGGEQRQQGEQQGTGSGHRGSPGEAATLPRQVGDHKGRGGCCSASVCTRRRVRTTAIACWWIGCGRGAVARTAWRSMSGLASLHRRPSCARRSITSPSDFPSSASVTAPNSRPI